MSAAAEFSSDQIEVAISIAIGRTDFGTAVGLIKYLAVQDPDRAELVLAAITTVIAERRESEA